MAKDSVFKKVLDGVRDPEKNNPEHARQVARDKEKEFKALTLPKVHDLRKDDE